MKMDSWKTRGRGPGVRSPGVRGPGVWKTRGVVLETPSVAPILIFTVTYAYSLLLKKKDECVNSFHWFGNLFLFARIQQGYVYTSVIFLFQK